MKSLLTLLSLTLCLTQVSGGEKATSSATTTGEYGSAETLGIIKNKELIELSGVVVGGLNKDILWVHNDRHNLPRLFALNLKGETAATYDLNTLNEEGTMAGDWEDIARLPGAKKGSFNLYIGDIGNNPMKKKIHQILVVAEPKVDPKKSSQVIDIKFKTIKFQFPDDYVCNSECLLIHPVTKTFYIVSKKVKKGNKIVKAIKVWSLPTVTDYEKVHTVQLVMDSIPIIEKNNEKITGGDISADGQFLILRSKERDAYLWKLKEKQPLSKILSEAPARITLAKGRGGEAVCFSLDNSKLFTVYDGKKPNRPLHTYLKK